MNKINNKTRVINKQDGECGIVQGICSRRRNGAIASYAVRLQDGSIEAWHVSEILIIN